MSELPAVDGAHQLTEGIKPSLIQEVSQLHVRSCVQGDPV